MFEFIMFLIVIGIIFNGVIYLEDGNPFYGLMAIILFIALLVIGFTHSDKEPNVYKIKTEYYLEILNQDSVAVYSLSTDKIYYVPFDKVEDVLLKDNL